MIVKNGMKCLHKPFGEWERGEVIAVLEGGKFMVSDCVIKVPQYDDSLRTYSQEDIGKLVSFEEDNTMFYPQVEGITPTVIHTQEDNP